MIIKKGMYNVPHVILESAVTSGTNTIGTSDDYNSLRAMVSQSGLFMGEMLMGGAIMKGTMTCNMADAGIEAYTITNEADVLRILVMYIYASGSNCKMDVTVYELPEAN